MGEDGLIHHQAYHGPGREDLERVFPLRVSDDSGSGLAILTRSVVHYPDVEKGEVPEQTRRACQAVGYKGVIFAPLVWEGKGTGVIFVGRDYAGPFSDKDIALLKTFADQAAIAIQNARLFNETKEALERQTATTEVLKVISESPTNVQPVFDIIAERAARLTGAESGLVFSYDGKLIDLASSYGVNSHLVTELRKILPARTDSVFISARAIRDGVVINEPDLQTIEVPGDVPKHMKEIARQAGLRGGLAVPMFRDRQVVGAIAMYRSTPGRFADKEVDLLRAFASQAVIAVENVRLFNETKSALAKVEERTRELTESLDYQTAISDVLRCISESPTDVSPVFEAILESARRLFGAPIAAAYRYDGELVHLVATPRLVARGARGRPAGCTRRHRLRSMMSGRVVMSGSVQTEDDSSIDPDYDQTQARLGGWRRLVGAPLLKDGRAVGAIVVAWPDPGKTPQRQIDLLKTFAGQAVIAIENVRLINETKEALERQTATSEVLEAISGAQTDASPVFETIARNAYRT